MDDLDDRLRMAGAERRRTTLGPPHHPTVEDLRAQKQDRRLMIVSAVSAALILVAVLGAWTLFIPKAPVAGGHLDPQVTVTDGTPVQATGTVIAAPAQPLMLCIAGSMRAGNYTPGQEPPPVCTAIGVRLSGLMPSALPGRTEHDGVVVANDLTVQGNWHAGGIDVQSVAMASLISEAAPAVPCAAPAGGWPTDPVSDVALETALRQLASALDASPSVYEGYWVTYAPATAVAVVSATGSLDSARASLSAKYKLPLCVVSGEFNTT